MLLKKCLHTVLYAYMEAAGSTLHRSGPLHNRGSGFDVGIYSMPRYRHTYLCLERPRLVRPWLERPICICILQTSVHPTPCGGTGRRPRLCSTLRRSGTRRHPRKPPPHPMPLDLPRPAWPEPPSPWTSSRPAESGQPPRPRTQTQALSRPPAPGACVFRRWPSGAARARVRCGIAGIRAYTLGP